MADSRRLCGQEGFRITIHCEGCTNYSRPIAFRATDEIFPIQTAATDPQLDILYDSGMKAMMVILADS